ncbi:DUF6221 family protein [Streptomyces sp. ALI-76-A]|uniref:DUF6221 family protein n=1 Tax=Streptomyces sp. ALI-76-A TaxID=3025736 RepID=UPI00256EC538|nr:DUF6221 family protein [Streptomyces sp. ALI-76-A]MDL5205110.1 DUF6221 family protein [Streptomyces sp. ALI-76-A]
MDELVQWLTAQLDEDQQAAEEALKRTTTTRRRIGGQWVEDTVQPPEWRRSAWSPARVLREIDAKRRILAECAHWHGKLAKEVVNPSPVPFPALGEVLDAVTPILRALALPYADRPGYREEWRP